MGAEAAQEGRKKHAPQESTGGEAGEKTEAKKSKDIWDKLQALSPLISGVVLAAIGYFLTGSVNQAIQKSQLQFSYLKKLQELLAKLAGSKASLEGDKTKAVAHAWLVYYTLAPFL